MSDPRVPRDDQEATPGVAAFFTEIPAEEVSDEDVQALEPVLAKAIQADGRGVPRPIVRNGVRAVLSAEKELQTSVCSSPSDEDAQPDPRWAELRMAAIDLMGAMGKDARTLQAALDRMDAALAALATVPTPASSDEDVEAGSRAVYELTRGAEIPGVINGLEVKHVGTATIARAVLSARSAREGESELREAIGAVEADLRELAEGDAVAKLPQLQAFLVERAAALRSAVSQGEGEDRG